MTRARRRERGWHPALFVLAGLLAIAALLGGDVLLGACMIVAALWLLLR